MALSFALSVFRYILIRACGKRKFLYNTIKELHKKEALMEKVIAIQDLEKVYPKNVTALKKLT